MFWNCPAVSRRFVLGFTISFICKKEKMDRVKKLTIPAFINDSISKNGEKTSLVYANEGNYAYSDLGKEMRLLAGLLASLGIEKGDKVAVLGPSSPNWGIAFLSVVSMGAVAVPILPDFNSKEVKNILEHSESKILIFAQNLYGLIEEDAARSCQHLILLDNFACVPIGCQASQLKNLAPALPAALIYPEINAPEEDDLASIIYTSGTTGNSKGVMLTHRNLAWTAQQCTTIQKIVPSDRFLSVLPLSHTLENTVGFLLPLFNGASVHYIRKVPTPHVLLNALNTVRPTKLLIVPLIIEKIFKTRILPKFQKSPVIRFLYSIGPIRKLLHVVAGKKLHKTFGGKLDFLGIGGAKLDGTVEKFLKEAKFPYAIGYGLTETSPLLAGTRVGGTRVGSTGPAMAGVSLRLGDVDPATGEGEIQAKGPNVMRGYYKAPEITRSVFTDDGWFKTGDRGWFDKNGFLYIKGRIKNMIVGSSGENIYPEDIESVINRMRYVLESLVLEKKGRLVAMIHLNMEEIENQYQHLKVETAQVKDKINEKIDEILKDIHKKVNEEVNKFSKLHSVVFHPSPFEKTPTKKIKRFLYV